MREHSLSRAGQQPVVSFVQKATACTGQCCRSSVTWTRVTWVIDSGDTSSQPRRSKKRRACGGKQSQYRASHRRIQSGSASAHVNRRGWHLFPLPLPAFPRFSNLAVFPPQRLSALLISPPAHTTRQCAPFGRPVPSSTHTPHPHLHPHTVIAPHHHHASFSHYSFLRRAMPAQAIFAGPSFFTPSRWAF
jgi:hypothetical protein